MSGALSGSAAADSSSVAASDPYGDSYAASASQGGESGCACCGGSGEEIEGATTVDGGIQRVNVDIGDGYVPNVIKAQAGIPIEMTFAQGSGCFAEVYFPEFDIFEDLTQGPKTITLPALEAGAYGWSCGMQMVYGTIVVE